MEIYIITYPDDSKFAEGYSINPTYDYLSAEKCPQCSRPVSNGIWSGPKKISVNKRKFPDFMYVYGCDLHFLVSKRAFDILAENHIQGIVSYDIIEEIQYKGKDCEQIYYSLTVQRQPYAIDHDLSRICYGQEQRTVCKCCNPTGTTHDFVFGLYFKDHEHINSDIFKVYEMGDTVFVSERFIDICKKNKLTGLCYENIHQYDSNLAEIFSSEQLIQMFGVDSV